MPQAKPAPNPEARATSARRRRIALYLGLLVAVTLLALNFIGEGPADVIVMDGVPTTRERAMDRAREEARETARKNSAASRAMSERVMRPDASARMARSPRQRERDALAARSRGQTTVVRQRAESIRPEIAYVPKERLKGGITVVPSPSGPPPPRPERTPEERARRRALAAKLALEVPPPIDFDPRWAACSRASECVAINTGCRWQLVNRNALPAVKASGYLTQGGIRMKCPESPQSRPPLATCEEKRCTRS